MRWSNDVPTKRRHLHKTSELIARGIWEDNSDRKNIRPRDGAVDSSSLLSFLRFGEWAGYKPFLGVAADPTVRIFVNRLNTGTEEGAKWRRVDWPLCGIILQDPRQFTSGLPHSNGEFRLLTLLTSQNLQKRYPTLSKQLSQQQG